MRLGDAVSSLVSAAILSLRLIRSKGNLLTILWVWISFAV